MLLHKTQAGRSLIKWLAALNVLLVLVGCERRISIDPAPQWTTALKLRSELESAGGGTTAAESAQTTASPTGFATLRGRFVVQGDPPPNPKLDISKDADICGARSVDLQLVVTPHQDGGGIANILIYAQDVPEDWVHESAKPEKTDDFIFDQKQCVFLTRVAAFQISQRIKILNSDPMGHNTKLSPRFSGSFNQTVPVGDFVYYQAEAEEKQPVSVECSIHPWMQAWMMPRQNSYFAVTDKDGNFEISQLPAGVEVGFRAWHEKTRFIQNVTVGGQKEKWSKGKFKRTLDPGSTDDLQVAVVASEFE